MAARKVDRSREPLTPEERDRIAEPTADDAQRAAERWRKDAPAQYKDMLDATPE